MTTGGQWCDPALMAPGRHCGPGTPGAAPHSGHMASVRISSRDNQQLKVNFGPVQT